MDYGKDQWVLPGYTVAKTKHYISKSISFSSSKKNTINLSDTERSKYPDPAKYAETIEKTFEKHWKKPFGGFSKLKKTNYLDEIIKRSKSTPGPGSYIKPLLTPNIDSGRRSPLGKFDKSEKTSYLNSVEYSAEETPDSWRYNPKNPERKIINMWVKPKVAGKVLKKEIGPGKYSEGVQKAYGKVLKNSPNFSFSKSVTPCVSVDKALKQKFVPGVGTYKEADKAYKKYCIKAERAAIIYPYNIKRFIETVVEESKKKPGPGAYEITPPIKRY